MRAGDGADLVEAHVGNGERKGLSARRKRSRLGEGTWRKFEKRFARE